MLDPLSTQPIVPPASSPAPVAPAEKVGGGDFANLIRAQLDRVSQMQTEADRGLEQVLTGQSENITDVFVAARKAEVAFSLLMEIRNKLVDAYEELRQLRV